MMTFRQWWMSLEGGLRDRMTLQEIKDGIIKMIHDNVPVDRITGERVTQSGKESILHVQLIPLSSKTAAAGYFVEKEILIDIAYMEELVTDNASIYRMLDTLDSIFKPCFRVGNRAFTCDGAGEIVDDVGHYKMTLRFTDTADIKTEEPLAKTLRVDWRN